ncbi:hypothetical protein MTBLM1_130010 [Rhodospirillaceae bacterium LM-1]|nr:hypothetical protein MTBLM1_130010 [Rhodospirillaceae bacterium LM-1]
MPKSDKGPDLHIRVFASERKAIEAAAKKAGFKLSDYVRGACLGAEIVNQAPILQDDQSLRTVAESLERVADWAQAHSAPADAVDILSVLVLIEKKLSDPLPKRGRK